MEGKMKEKIMWLLVIGIIPAGVYGILPLYYYSLDKLLVREASLAHPYISIGCIVYSVLVMSFIDIAPEG